MAGKRATRYSGNDYVLTVGGLDIDSGRGPDTFVEIAQQEDDVNYSAGMDGEGVFSENLNRYTIITVYLMQTSTGNARLSALHNASRRAGVLLYPVSGQDSRGTSKIVAEACVIAKMPDEAFAKEAGVTTWVLKVHAPEREIGSH
jgi:hypothetical protein